MEHPGTLAARHQLDGFERLGSNRHPGFESDADTLEKIIGEMLVARTSERQGRRVFVLVSRKESLKYAMPFGTFLAVGAFIAAVAGDAILDWYLGFF